MFIDLYHLMLDRNLEFRHRDAIHFDREANAFMVENILENTGVGFKAKKGSEEKSRKMNKYPWFCIEKNNQSGKVKFVVCLCGIRMRFKLPVVVSFFHKMAI